MSDRDEPEATEFHVRINGGEEQVFIAHTSIYGLAVMAAFGVLKLPYPCAVEIWIPDLVEAGYGPYSYQIGDFVDARGNRYGCPAILTVPGRSDEEQAPYSADMMPAYEMKEKDR